MAKYEALGMELNWHDEEGVTISPLCALVVVKGMDQDGNESYCVMNTSGLSNIEALGLIKFASLFVEDEVRGVLYETYGPDANETSAQK